MTVALDQEAVAFLKSIGTPDTYKNVNLLVTLIIRKQAEAVAERDALCEPQHVEDTGRPYLYDEEDDIDDIHTNF